MAAVSFTRRYMVVLTAEHYRMYNMSCLPPTLDSQHCARAYSVTLLKWGDSWKINVNQPRACVQEEPDRASTPLVVPGSMTRVQATSVLSKDVFYHTGTKIQSYGLFWRDGFFLPHCHKITVLCCFAEGCPSLGTAGEQRKSRTCPRMGHLLNLDQSHFM